MKTVCVLVTITNIGEDQLYSDILGVFNKLEDAELIMSKVKRGEKVDFIDTEYLLDYDDIVIIELTVRDLK